MRWLYAPSDVMACDTPVAREGRGQAVGTIPKQIELGHIAKRHPATIGLESPDALKHSWGGEPPSSALKTTVQTPARVTLSNVAKTS